MFSYFGYGSNMDMQALQLKGVCPVSSERGMLFGWKLVFDLRTFFQHEGGMGNVRHTGNPHDVTHGVLHSFHEEAIPVLDQMEGGGHAYNRVEVEIETYDGQKKQAHIYVARPERLLAKEGQPSRRYLNILIRGATKIGLAPAYIEKLRQTPTHPQPHFPPFEFPATPSTVFTAESLAHHPLYTALAGAVFDMSMAHEKYPFLENLLGGKESTLFFLRRMDSSNHDETLEEVAKGCLSEEQKKSLNRYLHEFNQLFKYMGRFDYQCKP